MAKLGKDRILKELIEFFLDEFAQDASGVADWCAQGDLDVNQLYSEVVELRDTMNKLGVAEEGDNG